MASLSPHTSNKQLNNREAGPLITWCREQQSWNPVRGPLYIPEWVEQQIRASQIGLLIVSCQRLEKDSDSAIAPVPEAVSVPAHLAPPGSP